MFTGIITDVGEVVRLEGAPATRALIGTRYPAEGIAIGASIACAGVCLTVTGKGLDGGRPWFSVDISEETKRCSTLGRWAAGTRVNLERSLRVGDELGGHIVTGHVDAMGRLDTVESEGASLRLDFSVPAALARFIASKGSIAVDGVSLTVNRVAGALFSVNIIPHTREATTLGLLRPGDPVNLEIDVVARYIARLSEREPAA